MRALADNGISMLGVPEEFGGIPADYVTQMLAQMEVSNAVLGAAFLIANGQCIRKIMRRFSSARAAKTAESTLETGDPAYALALTEPGAGSDNNSATYYTRKNGKVLSTDPENLYCRCERVPVYAGVGARSATERSQKSLHLWWVDSDGRHPSPPPKSAASPVHLRSLSRQRGS